MVETASFKQRFLGGLIDLVIGGIIALISVFLATMTGSDALFILIQSVVIIVWIYLEGSCGQSPGKIVLCTRVVNNKNQKIGFWRSVLRYGGRLLCMLTLGIGYLAIAWSKKKQGLHDTVANTYVIKV